MSKEIKVLTESDFPVKASKEAKAAFEATMNAKRAVDWIISAVMEKLATLDAMDPWESTAQLQPDVFEFIHANRDQKVSYDRTTATFVIRDEKL